MRLYSWFSLLMLLLVAGGCSSSTDSSTTANATGQETNLTDREKFLQQFKPIKPPFLLPDDEDTTVPKMDKAYLKDVLSGAKAISLSGTAAYDVPEVLTNSEDADYYPVGMLKTENGRAIIIHKEYDEGSAYDEHYFLCTLNAEGKAVETLCISLFEGLDDADHTERNASINEDYSIAVGEINVEGGKTVESRPKQFFIISPEGHIRNMKDGSKDNPA
jgi:hypothetical protein